MGRNMKLGYPGNYRIRQHLRGSLVLPPYQVSGHDIKNFESVQERTFLHSYSSIIGKFITSDIMKLLFKRKRKKQYRDQGNMTLQDSSQRNQPR